MTARKTDTTQKPIVEALRRCGVFVFPLHTVGKGCPDLLLSVRGRWFVCECKTGKSWKYTEAQRRFRRDAGAPVLVLTSARDAVAWFHSLRGGLDEKEEGKGEVLRG